MAGAAPASAGLVTRPEGTSGGKTSATARVTAVEGRLRISSDWPPTVTLRTRWAVYR